MRGFISEGLLVITVAEFDFSVLGFAVNFRKIRKYSLRTLDIALPDHSNEALKRYSSDTGGGCP